MSHAKRQDAVHPQETQQLSVPDSDMTQRVEPSVREIEITMINVFRALIEKVHNMQTQMGDFSRQQGILIETPGMENCHRREECF